MPMATDADIWRAASTLVELHGENAMCRALASVGLLIERGDFRAAEQWRRVAVAAEMLLSRHPEAHEAVH
jgi:hypothetical protein